MHPGHPPLTSGLVRQVPLDVLGRILDVFASLLDLGAGLIALALGFQARVVGGVAHGLLGLAGELLTLVLHLVSHSHRELLSSVRPSKAALGRVCVFRAAATSSSGRPL